MFELDHRWMNALAMLIASCLSLYAPKVPELGDDKPLVSNGSPGTRRGAGKDRLRKITEDEGVVLDISIVLQRDDLLRLDDMGWKNADRCKELTAGWEMPPQGRRG
jgi:hypothetical protein